MITLRDYQSRSINIMDSTLQADRAAGVRHKTVCGACVGAGKSVLIAEMARRETEVREGRCLIVTHSQELVMQDARKIADHLGYMPGVYCAGAGRKDTSELITVASKDSLGRNPLRAGDFTKILIDEAHGVSPTFQGMYWNIINTQPNADVIGLTGTPWRLESGPIYGPGRFFDRLLVDISIKELQSLGHLVPIVAKARDVMKAEKLKVRAGEYATEDQDDAIDPKEVMEAIKEHAQGRKKIMIFVPGVKSGNALFDAFTSAENKDPADWVGQVYGHTPGHAREETIDNFKHNGMRFIINCGTLTTGFDCPAVDCIILLRRTMSTALLIQMVGRGLRPCPDVKQDVLLLDYAGNFAIHPAIDEITPPPFGDEKVKKKTQRKCPKCESLCKSHAEVCQSCGEVLPKQDRALAFGNAAGMQSSADYEGKVDDFRKMAAMVKATNKRPVMASIKFKDRHGHWPTANIGSLAGHPFAWEMAKDEEGIVRRTMLWK